MLRRTALLLGLPGVSFGTALGAAPVCTLRAPVSPVGNTAEDEGQAQQLMRTLLVGSGCVVEMPVVPRARLMRLFFEEGASDLLLPATWSAERAQRAHFVALGHSTPTLVTLRSGGPAPASVQALLERPELQGVAVASYTFGPSYDQLIQGLQAQRRLTLVRDTPTVVRMVLEGRVQFTLLPATVLWSDLRIQPAEAQQRLQYTRLAGLSGQPVGVYISRRSLAPAEQRRLIRWFQAQANDGRFERAMRQIFPAEVLEADIRFPGPNK